MKKVFYCDKIGSRIIKVKSVQDTVLKSIIARNKNTVLFTDAFENFGSSEAVRQAFSRLHNAGVVVRLAKGIYLYSKKFELEGVSLAQIAEAVARRDKARILPAGAFALHSLGLSTQVPVNLVYITDGTPRTLQIGNKTIKFKKGAPKNFSFKSETMYLLVAALREMYDTNNYETKNRIAEILQSVPPEMLKHDLALAPERIKKYLTSLLNNEN